jgi:DNA polymerase III subunit alpha
VATNDSHYLCGEDSARARRDAVRADGREDSRCDRFKFDSDQFFVKSADEMARLFPDSPAVVQRTMEIAERCNLKLQQVDNPFPGVRGSGGAHDRQLLRAGVPRGIEEAARDGGAAT